MSAIKSSSTRRAFFLSGGAALGAGVAATAGASSLITGGKTSAGSELAKLQRQLVAAADREAIRQLQLTFTRLVETQSYESVADLFDEHGEVELSGENAFGKQAIALLFDGAYRHQTAAAMHSAYRPNALQQQDAVDISDDQLHATALFHLDVALCSPLQGECTAAQMARLQGQSADRQWQAGRFVAKYVKSAGQWRMAALRYIAA
jgi:hypothetical protein